MLKPSSSKLSKLQRPQTNFKRHQSKLLSIASMPKLLPKREPNKHPPSTHNHKNARHLIHFLTFLPLAFIIRLQFDIQIKLNIAENQFFKREPKQLIGDSKYVTC